MGCFKVCTVAQGFKETKLYLDGPDFDYTANVCELAAVRNLLFKPRNSPYNDDGTPHLTDNDKVVAMCDVATAYLQATCSSRLTEIAPHARRYFQQIGKLIICMALRIEA